MHEVLKRTLEGPCMRNGSVIGGLSAVNGRRADSTIERAGIEKGLLRCARDEGDEEKQEDMVSPL